MKSYNHYLLTFIFVLCSVTTYSMDKKEPFSEKAIDLISHNIIAIRNHIKSLKLPADGQTRLDIIEKAQELNDLNNKYLDRYYTKSDLFFSAAETTTNEFDETLYKKRANANVQLFQENNNDIALFIHELQKNEITPEFYSVTMAALNKNLRILNEIPKEHKQIFRLSWKQNQSVMEAYKVFTKRENTRLTNKLKLNLVEKAIETNENNAKIANKCSDKSHQARILYGQENQKALVASLNNIISALFQENLTRINSNLKQMNCLGTHATTEANKAIIEENKQLIQKMIAPDDRIFIHNFVQDILTKKHNRFAKKLDPKDIY